MDEQFSACPRYFDFVVQTCFLQLFCLKLYKQHLLHAEHWLLHAILVIHSLFVPKGVGTAKEHHQIYPDTAGSVTDQSVRPCPFSSFFQFFYLEWSTITSTFKRKFCIAKSLNEGKSCLFHWFHWMFYILLHKSKLSKFEVKLSLFQ